jgi:quercetin dioxygenase-like cupin family protein
MQLISTKDRRWLPSGFTGVRMSQLHGGEEGGGTVLLEFAPGAEFPAHDHLSGEELFVVEGSAVVGSSHLAAGDYLWTPSGETHGVSSEAGALLLVRTARGIRVLE